MISPKPPSARMVSQRKSSSEMVPSSWLCWFVRGANMKRFFMVGPWLNVKESVRLVMSENAVVCFLEIGQGHPPPIERIFYKPGFAAFR
jgi:hypothetical protein